MKNHSRKGETGSPLEEIVKDADLLDCSMYGYDFPRQEQRDRLERLLKDMEADDGRQLKEESDHGSFRVRAFI